MHQYYKEKKYTAKVSTRRSQIVVEQLKEVERAKALLRRGNRDTSEMMRSVYKSEAFKCMNKARAVLRQHGIKSLK